MNQLHWRANNRFKSKIDGKGYICLENQALLTLNLSAMIHADSVSFLTPTDDRIQKYSSMFGFPWTNPLVSLKN